MIGAKLPPDDVRAMERCGISVEVIDAAQLRRVNSAEGAQVVGRNGSGDYAGILFPYFWPGVSEPREYRLRRDHPDIVFEEGKEKEKNKYLSPPGRNNLLYFPPGMDVKNLADISLPIVIAEGEKKTLALSELSWHAISDNSDRPQFLSIGIAGVWNWRGTIGKTEGADGQRVDVKGVIPDFDQIVWKGRKVTVVFDSNVNGNDSVQAAFAGLSQELRRRGAVIWRFIWPTIPAGINGIDDLVGIWGRDRVLALLSTHIQPAQPTASDQRKSTRQFDQSDDHYVLEFKSLGICFIADRLRRERHELIGELGVRCSLPGAKTVNGYLLIGDFNFSSIRARTDRAKILHERANAKDLDWLSLLEELCHKVLQAERAGTPSIDLRTFDAPKAEDHHIEGLVFPKSHPAILFGDGGTGKSYVALYLAGRLALSGLNIALFDWELSGEDHHHRLKLLFGDRMPMIHYCRCDRPLTTEVDRLRRIVQDQQIDYAFYDSIAFACDGRPEDAEIAGRYFRAVRQINCGSLHLAHVNKSDDSDRKPFGSNFWHNGARSTWFVQSSEDSTDQSLKLGFFNRKSNMGPIRQAVSLLLRFGPNSTEFQKIDIADTADFAAKLSVRTRMMLLLRNCPLSANEIADQLDADLETVRRTIRRSRDHFIVLDGGKVGLVDRRM